MANSDSGIGDELTDDATDAALGQAMVSDPRLPVRVRQTLESGLNDGLVVPVIAIQ